MLKGGERRLGRERSESHGRESDSCILGVSLHWALALRIHTIETASCEREGGRIQWLRSAAVTRLVSLRCRL